MLLSLLSSNETQETPNNGSQQIYVIQLNNGDAISFHYYDASEKQKFFRDVEKELAMAMMSSVTAFYEFNSFIGAYLMHAKENYYDIYTSILNNSSLVDAYSTVTYNFSVIAEKIHAYFEWYLVKNILLKFQR